MDKPVLFNKDEHYPEVALWFKRHGKRIPTKDMLSSSGIIIPGLACGFLYMTDSSIAYLDFYCSNPDSTKEDRAKAFAVIQANLIAWAKDAGTSHLTANTQVPTMQKLMLESGLIHIGNSEHYLKEF